MDKETRVRLHKISTFGLLIGGLIFLGLSIFGESRADLTLGLCLITLGNVHNARFKSEE